MPLPCPAGVGPAAGRRGESRFAERESIRPLRLVSGEGGGGARRPALSTRVRSGAARSQVGAGRAGRHRSVPPARVPSAGKNARRRALLGARFPADRSSFPRRRPNGLKRSPSLRFPSPGRQPQLEAGRAQRAPQHGCGAGPGGSGRCAGSGRSCEGGGWDRRREVNGGIRPARPIAMAFININTVILVPMAQRWAGGGT